MIHYDLMVFAWRKFTFNWNSETRSWLKEFCTSFGLFVLQICHIWSNRFTQMEWKLIPILRSGQSLHHLEKRAEFDIKSLLKKTTKYNKKIIHVIDWSKWWKNVTEWETVQLYSSKIGFNQNSRIRILLEESHDLSRWLSSLICIIQSNRFTRLKGKQWLMLQGWY